MNGQYIYRPPEYHTCLPPLTGEAPGPRLGDIWRCDCGRAWRLENRWWWGEHKWRRFKEVYGLRIPGQE